MAMGIIDFHIHWFPPELERQVREFATKHEEPFWGALMAPELGKSLQGWLSVDEMLRKMDEAGIEKAVMQGWYWQRLSTCVQHNRWMLEVVSQHPDRFEAYASIIPTGDGRDFEELHWAYDHGFRGIGELHPGAQGFALQDTAWLELAEAVQERNLPILFHVTEPVGRDYEPRADTDFRELQQFIERFDRAPIILAHLGGLVFLHLLNPYIGKRWKHVYVDTAALPLLYRTEVLNVAMEVLGADRVLFGSDFPLKLYPKASNQPEFGRILKALEMQVANVGHWEKFARANAETLLSK